MTTNVPLAEWNQVFLDATAAAAVIDRIVHHSAILKTEGQRFRLKQAKQGKARTKEGAAT